MTINDVFTLGNKFRQDGNLQMAVQIWQECVKTDPFFGPAHVNLADTFRIQGNIQGEKHHLNLFLDCPVTGRTLPLVQQVNARIAEIDKPAQPAQAPK